LPPCRATIDAVSARSDKLRMNLSDDDFTLFGLPRRFAIDAAALDARWRALQSEVHPDRFVAQGAAAQRLAMQWSVRVNEAYRRLRNPLARLAYLCELNGAPAAAEDRSAMPAAFLMQQMRWHEALDEADGSAALHALAEEVDAQQAERLQRGAGLLDDSQDAIAASAEVRALMFIERLQGDIRRRLDALDN
jgi:molecular chaperone HscB